MKYHPNPEIDEMLRQFLCEDGVVRLTKEQSDKIFELALHDETAICDGFPPILVGVEPDNDSLNKADMNQD